MLASNRRSDLALGGLVPCWENHTHFVGQGAKGLPEVQVLPLHHEGEHVAPHPASPEAVPGLSVWINYEGRSPFIVEGAGRLERPPRLLERHGLGNNINDVEPVPNLFYGCAAHLIASALASGSNPNSRAFLKPYRSVIPAM